MKQLKPLIIIAVLANTLTIVLYYYVESQPPGAETGLVFMILWMPILWVTTFVATLITATRNRNNLFKKPLLKFTLPVLLFTTPIPLIAVLYFNTPAMYNEGMGLSYVNGKVYITEDWAKRRNGGRREVEKHFVADSAEERLYGEKTYKKDSTWIYFNDKGDTAKIEYYKNDTLLFTKQHKEK